MEFYEYVKFKEAIRPDFDPRKYEPASDDAITTVVWGKPGASPFQQQQETQLKAEDEKSTETKRTYDVVRVKDPDNKDNHIDVEVMTAYQLRNKISGQRTSITLARTQASEDVEIISRGNTRSSET